MRNLKSIATLFALLLHTTIALGRQEPQRQTPARRIAEEIAAHDTGTAVWWTGHNGWLIKSGKLLIGTDLVTEERDRIDPSPITTAELAPLLDIAFITHAHGDHFHRATCRILAEQGRCVFVMPANCVDEARRIGIPEDRIHVARPREPFELKGIHITPLRAIHGNGRYAVYRDANLDDCGYQIEMGGASFLQPGDSVLLEDHLFLKHVDVLFFSPTEHNTYIDPSVILINELEPDYILPQHRDTYRVTPDNRFWAVGHPHEVRQKLSKGLRERYHILELGQNLAIDKGERTSDPPESLQKDKAPGDR